MSRPWRRQPRRTLNKTVQNSIQRKHQHTRLNGCRGWSVPFASTGQEFDSHPPRCLTGSEQSRTRTIVDDDAPAAIIALERPGMCLCVHSQVCKL